MNRLLALAVVWCCATVCVTAADVGTPLDQAWDDASAYRSNDARQGFVQIRDKATTATEKREADFGEAISLLNVQPKTDGNLDRAVSLFQSVQTANADDDLGVASLYFMGRIEQYQRLPPNIDKTSAYYREAFEKHPEHFWGEQSAIKLAMIEIYRAATSAEQLQVLAKYEALGDKFTNPQCQRDLYFVLARSYLNLRLSPDKALADLLRTQTFGYSLSGLRADNYVRIAELARQTNHPDVAVTYYNKFISEFPFDSRVYTVKLRLQALAPAAITSAP